jgi:hypothetical protein
VLLSDGLTAESRVMIYLHMPDKIADCARGLEGTSRHVSKSYSANSSSTVYRFFVRANLRTPSRISFRN